eukprot:2087277-Rhodomonas_salina.1
MHFVSTAHAWRICRTPHDDHEWDPACEMFVRSGASKRCTSSEWFPGHDVKIYLRLHPQILSSAHEVEACDNVSAEAT